jgi:hypothetical protein
MRKFRASMEPFGGLKTGECVEYLIHVSSKYIRSWVLLSLTSTAGRTSRVLLADVIPWTNIASLALHVYIARAMSRTNLKFDWKLYCTSSSSPVFEESKLVTVELESRSQRLRRCGSYTMYALYWWPLTISTIRTIQLLGMWSSVS